MAVFYFVLDVAITNAFILYTMSCKSNGVTRTMSHSQFREELAVQLASGVANIESPIARMFQTTNQVGTTDSQSDSAPDATPLRGNGTADAGRSADIWTQSERDTRKRRSEPIMHGLVQVEFNASGRRKERYCCYDRCEQAKQKNKTSVRSIYMCPACDRGYCPPCFSATHVSELMS
jgi:hypothetical protein